MARQKRETKFCKRLIKVLESQCAFIINFHGHTYQKSGLPDLEVLHRRWDGFLELKCEKNKPTALQKSIAKKIKDRGTPVFVFRCVDDKVNALGVATSWNYQLEDFYGVLISKVPELKDTLDVLVDLSKPKFDIVTK